MPAGLILLLLAEAVLVADDPHPAGVVMTGKLALGPSGTALYTYDGGGLGNRCIEECLNGWAPADAAPGDKPVGDWAPKVGPSGRPQWTHQDRLLYYYQGDKGGTRAAGDGRDGVWHALRYVGPTPAVIVPPAAQVTRDGTTYRLTDQRGHTLYSFARDGKTPACAAACLEVWPPLLAPALARTVGRWTPVDRPDGVRQWAYRGRLLYTFSDDVVPGDRNGAQAGKLWRTIEITRRDGDAPTGETK